MCEKEQYCVSTILRYRSVVSQEIRRRFVDSQKNWELQVNCVLFCMFENLHLFAVIVFLFHLFYGLSQIDEFSVTVNDQRVIRR